MNLCLWLPFLLSFWYYFLDFDHMNIFTDLSVSTYTCESFIYFYYFFKLYSASQMVWPERMKRKEEKALRPMLTLRRSREGKSISSVHSLNHVWLFVTPWTAACQASLPITNSQSPLKPVSIESVMPSNQLILCYPLLLLPSIFPSIRIFSNESAFLIKWPKYGSFSFSISPSMNTWLISFRMDWLALLAVQGTLKSLLQHHSSKVSILQCSASFIVQLSHPYMTTGKTIALTRQTFVGKVMSLLCNILCRLVITFLPRSKRLLISWLQSPSAVILEPRKIKSATVSTVLLSICHEVVGPDAMILVF